MSDKKEIKKFKIKGTLVRFRFEKGYRGMGKEKWNICVNMEKPVSPERKTEILSILGIDEKDRFCPSWLKKEGETHVNVHSIFDIPIQNEKGFIMDMLDLFEGAVVSMIINVKEGAIYPAVIKVHKNGTPSNPFADFDDCEEV